MDVRGAVLRAYGKGMEPNAGWLETGVITNWTFDVRCSWRACTPLLARMASMNLYRRLSSRRLADSKVGGTRRGSGRVARRGEDGGGVARDERDGPQQAGGTLIAIAGFEVVFQEIRNLDFE